jgi:ankyrin repeat protein
MSPGPAADRARAFKAAATWDLAGLAALLAGQPDLARAKDRIGYTLLHRAAMAQPVKLGRLPEDGVAVASVLLDAGAGLEAVRPIPDDGEIFAATPLWCATAFRRNRPLARDFLRRGAKADACLWAAVFGGDADLLSALLGVRPSLDLTADGETPFFYAVRLRRFAAARQLAEAGADPSRPNRAGETPLELARRRRYPKPILAWLAGLTR